MIPALKSRDHSINSRGLIYGLYDWALSPVSALHATFIFAVYFTTTVMPEGGSAAWAWMNAGAALIIAAIAPFLGAFADQHAIRKKLLSLITIFAAIALACLWWIEPRLEFAAIALILSALVIISTELGFVLYNALLPQMAGRKIIGRVSGIAWGVGYFGAIICLGIALGFITLVDFAALGLNETAMEHIRIIMPFAALWYVIFALPFFLLVPEGKKSNPQPFLANLREGLHLVMTIPGLFRFLLARIFYTDALVTLFAMGGIFAARVHDFTQSDVIIFAIILNITAGIGAVLGGWFDDILGSIKTIRYALILMIGVSIVAVLSETLLLFWIAGSLLGFFVGPLQASARSHIAKHAPQGTESRLFGFMVMTGKVTAFLGPFAYGLMVFLTGNERMGMAIVIVLLVLGALILPRD